MSIAAELGFPIDPFEENPDVSYLGVSIPLDSYLAMQDGSAPVLTSADIRATQFVNSVPDIRTVVPYLDAPPHKGDQQTDRQNFVNGLNASKPWEKPYVAPNLDPVLNDVPQGQPSDNVIPINTVVDNGKQIRYDSLPPASQVPGAIDPGLVAPGGIYGGDVQSSLSGGAPVSVGVLASAAPTFSVPSWFWWIAAGVVAYWFLFDGKRRR